MSVTKIEKEELSSTVTELKSNIESLKGQKDTLASALSGANDYDGLNISGAAKTLSSNLDVVIQDLETVQQNMDGYITKVSELDNDDFSSGGGSGSGGGSRNYSGGGGTYYSGGGSSYSGGGSTSYSSTGTQPGGQVKELGDSTEITLPDGLGVVKTYMGWQCITAKNSQQYKLIEAAGMNFDSEGFGKIGDRYVIATTTTYGNVGDYLDVVQEDGTVLKCIIGDIKNQNDAGCNKWGHLNGQCVVEFVVDKNSWYSGGKGSHANPGTANCHPEWHQGVTKIINRGNYFTNPKGPTTTTSNSNQDITSIEMSTGAAVNYSVGTKSTSSSASAAASNVANVDISKYHNNTVAGFEVTTGNKTYNLNDNDLDLLCAIVSAESDKGYDDALAVTTTILNRCETSNWINSYGEDPIKQATAPNQFVVYQEGHYKKFTNGNAPDEVRQAVLDALNGVRNHDYLSFRSNSSSGYSNNMISSTGNRYK